MKKIKILTIILGIVLVTMVAFFGIYVHHEKNKNFNNYIRNCTSYNGSFFWNICTSTK